MNDKVKRPPKMFFGNEICEGFCLLSDEEAGRVIREACAMHLTAVLDGHQEPEGEGLLVWRMLKRGLDVNASEYVATCKRNRLNSLAGYKHDDGEQAELKLEGGSAPAPEGRKRRKQIVFDRELWVYTHIPDDDVQGWMRSYPGIDVEREITKAAQWQKDHPSNVKKDQRKFLGGWMGRSFGRIEQRGWGGAPGGGEKVSRSVSSGVD